MDNITTTFKNKDCIIALQELLIHNPELNDFFGSR